VTIGCAPGDDITKGNLCAKCSEGAAPDFASLVQAGCHYCGGAFHCGAPDLSAQSSGNLKLSALCKRCAEEFYGYCERHLPGFGTEAGTPNVGSEQDSRGWPPPQRLDDLAWLCRITSLAALASSSIASSGLSSSRICKVAATALTTALNCVKSGYFS
jgi:hypothetical protein